MSVSYLQAGKAGDGINELNLFPKTFPPVFNPWVQTAEPVPAISSLTIRVDSGRGGSNRRGSYNISVCTNSSQFGWSRLPQ